MPDNEDDPKTKSEKIKFFKIDREGDIAPAFPQDLSPMEPVFDPNAPMTLPPSPGMPPPDEPPPMWDLQPMQPTAGPLFAPQDPVYPAEPVYAEPLVPLTAPPAPAAPSGLDPLSLPLTFSTEREEILQRAELERPIEAPPAVDPQLESRVDQMKPQVDSIARMGNLSPEQIDVLRKYISLKEAEVRDLRDQQRQYQTFVKKVSSQVESHTRKNRELQQELETRRREENALRSELRDTKDRQAGELAMQKNEYEDKLRRSGNYDAQAEDLYRKREEWKEKVREELKRIKLKERELENKHELLKRDMQALLDSKDKHVLELKKKNDALELEMESLEDRLRKANVVMAAIDSKKKRLVETMKLAIALLEGIDAVDREADDEFKRKAG